LIFAEWCGHCQALKPEWARMKESLDNHPGFKKRGGIIIEIEDSDPEKDIKIDNINKKINSGTKLQANGYPTIFKKTGGMIEYYEGGRSADEMRAWFLGGNGIVGGYRISRMSKRTK
jgi:thiol-disulfide isomerase/thioredoxin